MTANNDTSKNTNKNVCLKLDDTESARLGYIMHEIHGTLTSIDREISDIAKADLSFPKNHAEIKEKAVTAQRLSTELRTLLDFWQISNSNNYFENSVAHPQALWNKFYHLNSYQKSFIRNKHLTYTLIPQPDFNRRAPIADFVGFPIINAIANILIDNATKYSPDGDEIICEFEDGRDYLTIMMENNGPYITPEEISQIFLCGMRGKNADLIEANGHGYGMNFLKLIVDAHDGEINISSSHDYSLNGIPYGKYVCTINLPKYVYETDDQQIDDDSDDYYND